MRFLPFKPEAFAAAVSMDTSFGYLPSEQEDTRSLRELHRVLRQDGVLVVDVFNRERLIKRYIGTSPAKRREYPSFILSQKRTVSADGMVLCDRWEIHDKADGQVHVFEHVARLYSRSQLQGLLAKAGFKVTAAYGDYENQSFGADSSRLIAVAHST